MCIQIRIYIQRVFWIYVQSKIFRNHICIYIWHVHHVPLHIWLIQIDTYIYIFLKLPLPASPGLDQKKQHMKLPPPVQKVRRPVSSIWRPDKSAPCATYVWCKLEICTWTGVTRSSSTTSEANRAEILLRPARPGMSVRRTRRCGEAAWPPKMHLLWPDQVESGFFGRP